MTADRRKRTVRQIARERVPEGVRIDSLPWRDRWLLYIAYPTNALRYFRHRWRQWTVLPDSEWWDVCRDIVYVVREVKADTLYVEEWAGLYWDRREELRQDPRCWVCTRIVPRSEIANWWPR